MYFAVFGVLLTSLLCVILVTSNEDPYVLDLTEDNAYTLSKNLSLGRTDIGAPFAICSNYYEQQTNAILNLWSMQMWAKVTGFRLTEPFASQSTLGLRNEILQDSNFTNVLKFSDYVDLDFWTKVTNEKYQIPPLEKWNTFVLYPSKITVVAILVHDKSPIGAFIGNGIDKHPVCAENKKSFFDRHAKLFNRLQIQVVRNVCFVFNHKEHSSLSLHRFNSFFVLNNNVNVWFSQWRGIHFDRIPISDHKELKRTHHVEPTVLAMAKISPRILKDSKYYINTNLKVGVNEYTAVSLRAGNRKTYLASHGYSKQAIMQYMYDCAKNIEIALDHLSSNNNFLASDLGKFGDLGAEKPIEYDEDGNYHSELFDFILKTVYGNKSIDEYHNELIRAANGIEDSGYIGAMQKTIAENAQRLIVVGGHSTFQKSLVMKFKAKNQNCKNCVIEICYK